MPFISICDIYDPRIEKRLKEWNYIKIKVTNIKILDGSTSKCQPWSNDYFQRAGRWVIFISFLSGHISPWTHATCIVRKEISILNDISKESGIPRNPGMWPASHFENLCSENCQPSVGLNNSSPPLSRYHRRSVPSTLPLGRVQADLWQSQRGLCSGSCNHGNLQPALLCPEGGLPVCGCHAGRVFLGVTMGLSLPLNTGGFGCCLPGGGVQGAPKHGLSRVSTEWVLHRH